MPIYILGFPFGAGLATSGKNPAITVSLGHVSSIRQDEFQRTVAIQIDGNINPGNSGGPIVTPEGVLAGIAVAKLQGTQIGFAIPERELRAMLLGRVSDASFRRTSEDENGVKLAVRARVIDPLRRLKGVAFHFLALGKLREPPKPRAAGDWGLISSDAQPFSLTLSGEDYEGEIHLVDAKKGQSRYVVQPAYTRENGETLFGAPALIDTLAANLAVASMSSTKPEEAPALPKPVLPNDDWITRPPEAITDFSTLTEEDAFFYHPPATVLETRRSLLGTTRPLGEGTPLVLRRLWTGSGRVLPSAVWSADSKRLFLATDRGSIRSITLPDFVEERRLELGATCSYFGQSSAGLVAALEASNNLVVIDPDTLATKRHIHVPSIATVACAASSPRAYVSPSIHSKELLIIDLEKGRLVNRVQAPDIAPQPEKNQPAVFSSFDRVALSPDGNFLIAESNQKLHRLAVVNETMLYDDQSLMISAQQSTPWTITPDSKYILFLFHSPIRANDHQRLSQGAYVFPLANLQRPSLALPTKHSPDYMALDTNRRRAYTLSNSAVFGIHELTGDATRTYPLEDKAVTARGLLLAPDGEGMLIILNHATYWISLPSTWVPLPK
jgi:hypothetical protein